MLVSDFRIELRFRLNFLYVELRFYGFGLKAIFQVSDDCEVMLL